LVLSRPSTTRLRRFDASWALQRADVSLLRALTDEAAGEPLRGADHDGTRGPTDDEA